MNSTNDRLKILLSATIVFAALATAYATNTYMNQFTTLYPATVSSRLNSCVLCHLSASGGGSRNAYGEAFRSAGHSFTAVENLDSDGDGHTNIQEINALTFPGDATSRPASSDTTAPTVTAFSLPASAATLTVSVTSFTASDNVAVTGYLLTQSATKPAAGVAGWTAAPPASYTFASAGSKTVYAWAKDGAGNVSAARSANTTITLPSGSDVTAPTVTAFAVPSTSSSLTVTINLLSASDNIGVTGYLLTESSAAPAANTSGWTPSPPARYVFASAGSKVLYAWAKDAAGNISAGRSATTIITLAPTADTTRPKVTSFALPSVSGATTIALLTFSASDNVAVTGYFMAESSTAPAAGAAGWSPVPISRYTFASAGAKTVFAWARDAAGNVSPGVSAKTTITIPPVSGVPKSINSTSQNRSTLPTAMVSEQSAQRLAGYQVVAANDLGMHCGDLDQRVASILPPFNVLHAQVIQKGHVPRILNASQVEVVHSAASNPQDPAQLNTVPSSIYKTNFWDKNARTGNALAFDAFDAYYPAGVLGMFALLRDIGLPVPDLQQLYLGNGTLVADQQIMPSATAPSTTKPYSANVPQRFALYYQSLPFFIKFPFGYTLSKINWFSAEGIPVTPFDDMGRSNPYPLMRIQARAIAGNTLGLAPGAVMASLDTVTPVSGEVDCRNCHTSPTDGGSGAATGALSRVATRYDDPSFGKVPEAVSIEYAYDTNILRLHDLRHGTTLQSSTPVSCQKCHYTPALDLAHVGPANANGRSQTSHQSFSRVMHAYHGALGMFPQMPSPAGRSAAVRDYVLSQTCYQCHPGKATMCFRGAMFNAGQACQDCHGDMAQVGNDFSQKASSGGGFALAADYYTNAKTLRVPWANEPTCQSCHTGDVNSNLAGSTGVVKGPDGLRLIQAWRSGDANAKPIIAANRRFAENQTGSGSTTKQVLYRLSIGHGGVFCEGCHGSTHAEWPNQIANSNDNVTATQLQGHSGKIVECSTCHGTNTLTISDFRGKFDANGRMRGPHGMHPVDQRWVSDHHDVFKDDATPRGTCQACHGSRLQGSPLARTAADRTFSTEGRTRTIAKGTQVSCTLCHENPLNDD